MDIKRVVLYAALAFVLYSLWNTWQVENPTAVATATMSVPTTNQNDHHLLPTVPDGAAVQQATLGKEQSMPSQSVAKIVSVQTDVLDLNIDLQQGDITSAQLLQYPQSVENKNKPFSLLQDSNEGRYVADSSLFVVSGQSVENLNLNYTTAQQEYKLGKNEKQIVVTLSGSTQDGLSVQKKLTFTKGSYLIGVSYSLVNNGTNVWTGYMNTQLLRTTPPEDKSSMFHVGSYTGTSYSNPGVHKYQKVTFKDMTKTNLDAAVTGGWVAIQQHYFLSAWVPDGASKSRFYTRANNGDYTIGVVSQPLTLQPQQTKTVSSRLYIGPEDTATLKGIAPGLELTVDYGWLWFISSLLFSVMKTIYSFIGNWGWSIVLVTMLIKLAFYRLQAKSFKSMAGMRKLQPKMQALRERYGDDKAKISQATIELYRQEKVNPLGGCLPILVQIPVFIALYWVLLESVELRQAPFIFWITDLAASDPYHVLPLIMGVTMLIQQKLNPAPPDPTQAKVMMFLPILFTGLLWNFPSGLVLYWTVNNTLSILQQWYITHKFGDTKPMKKLPAANS